MATIEQYPSILRKIIDHYAQFKPAVGEIDNEVIIDEQQGHFELRRAGWLNGYRVHGSLIHVDIRNGKFWIEHDGTEYGVANELRDAGVPPEHIVLAFHPPELRQYTDFAAN